ncbi:MAG: TadA family conjugal transfer-associated ATPase [Micrococcales bacterium]|nr:TadA family conjugal transfer-associated ATPase [Micrococcales bacterium]
MSSIAAPAPLLALLDQPEISDVLINGPGEVWVDGAVGLRRGALHLGDLGQLRVLATGLAAQGGVRLDEACPAADVHLPGGVRLHAVLPPVAPDGPLLSFRVLRRKALSLDQLVDGGTIPPEAKDVMTGLVHSRVNFLVTGATGAGKTTLLAALLGLVSPEERIVLIEEASEIATTHPHCVRLEAKAANTEGRGAFTLTDLVRQALRMRPDRIVVGECRGAEVRELLMALNTGHEGSCGTIHANSPADLPARLVALGSLAGMGRGAVATQAAAALTAVLHVSRERGTARRRLTQIAALALVGAELTVVPAVTLTADAVQPGPGYQALALACGWEQ